jgi:hypothetical protein
MKKWTDIKVGDLVRCAGMPKLGIGVVVEIRSYNSGQANAMCYWATPDKRLTYFLDQLVAVEDK